MYRILSIFSIFVCSNGFLNNNPTRIIQKQYENNEISIFKNFKKITNPTVIKKVTKPINIFSL